MKPWRSHPLDVVVPPNLQPYIEYVSYSLGGTGADGVSMKLTEAGIHYARKEGARTLGAWLMQQTLWKGNRTLENVTSEILHHALFAHWPLISARANPVDIEYFQPWPMSLLLAVPNRVVVLCTASCAGPNGRIHASSL
jgi:hypothetical protein